MIFSFRKKSGLPIITTRPAMVPRTPPAVTERKSFTDSKAMLCSFAPCTIAAASGCSLLCSSEAARRRNSFASKPPVGKTSISFGLPSVRVPVLSTTSMVTFSSRSSASAFFTSTPSCAPRPTPTMMDIGVAKPRAHGQAMMRTATALTMA